MEAVVNVCLLITSLEKEYVRFLTNAEQLIEIATFEANSGLCIYYHKSYIPYYV